jgi:hypothetical protein
MTKNSDYENISYLCSNNNSNINEIGLSAEEIERFKMNKYKMETNSNNSEFMKYNVDTNNLQSDMNTNKSNFISNNEGMLNKNNPSTEDVKGNYFF